MANICDNTFYANGSEENLQVISDYFDKWDYAIIDWYDTNDIDITFESKWTFPEEMMNDLFELIPDKSNIYMRCLSVEYDCLYHALWICDENGWKEV